MKKHKTKLIWVGVIIVTVGLMYWGGQTSSAGTWEDTEVACLPGGHQNALTHIHVNLSVFIDGDQQDIPSNVGINSGCMAEVHTHNAGGEIHIETPDQQHELTVTDFFAVWDQPFQRASYTREILVNGQEATPDYVFSDGDQIEVRFSSTDTSTTTSAETSTTATTSG